MPLNHIVMIRSGVAVRHRWAVTLGLLCATVLPLAAPVSAAAAVARPPKLDLHAAEAALATHQIYRAPGAVAAYDEAKVAAALGPSMKLLVEPFTGEFGKGQNYATDDQYVAEVYSPLEDWATDHHVQLLDVTGLSVTTIGGDAFGPSTLAEVRGETAYLDVTSSLLGMINYLRTKATHFDDLPSPPIVPPTPAQLAALTSRLRVARVYNAPDRTDPVRLPASEVARTFGAPVRVAALAPLRPGQPMVDYAPALAKQFPGEDVFVSYGDWLDVAGPHQAAMESARNYAYGRFLDATLSQGVNMANRIGTVLKRTDELVRKHPFARPLPTPFDLQHRISALAPWVLVGSAVLLAAGPLLGWQRRRLRAAHAEHLALRRESALAAAAIADLDERVLRADPVPEDAAERQATARQLFDQATTADAMREVRAVAEQGEAAMPA
jgi:hypothetical protein